MSAFLAALALLCLGLVLRLSAARIGLMLGILWLAVLLAHLTLPEGHLLTASFGGTIWHWLGLGVLAAMALCYVQALGWLRRRAGARAAPVAKAGGGTFSEAELDRYARHIVLREVGGSGQKKLRAAKVLVVGAGGLGSPALLYLAAAGVGRIGVIDDDLVSNSNLQRQVIHADARIGMAKAFSAEIAMKALNPFIEVRPYQRRLGAAEAEALFAEYDLILDGSDNFDTRYLVNAAAVAAGKPLISAAITQWEGQIGVYDPAQGGPCYACVFPKAPGPGLAPACAEAGVMGALPGILGAMMAAEAIKALTGAGEVLRGKLLIHDALHGESRVIAVARDAGCPVCGEAK